MVLTSPCKARCARCLILRDAERAHRAFQLRHLVERVAEQPLGHAQVAQLLHAAARAHLGGVVGHEAAALREEPLCRTIRQWQEGQ